MLPAENLPCESHLDAGHRAAFANGACAPLVVEGPQLAAARAALLERLPALGFGVTKDPALRIDGADAARDDARLAAGWHEAEPGRRWSDGAGTILADGARTVELRLYTACGYHLCAKAAEAA